MKEKILNLAAMLQSLQTTIEYLDSENLENEQPSMIMILDDIIGQLVTLSEKQ